MALKYGIIRLIKAVLVRIPLNYNYLTTMTVSSVRIRATVDRTARIR